jgi:hypothetical protein
MSEIAKFDQASLMQNVRERIKATFVGLIPDEEWEALVRKEVDAFLNEKASLTFHAYEEQKHGWYARPEKPAQIKSIDLSPFRAMVWQECAARLQKALGEALNDELFVGHCHPTKLTEEAERIIKESGAAIAADFFSRIISTNISIVQSTIMSEMQSR